MNAIRLPPKREQPIWWPPPPTPVGTSQLGRRRGIKSQIATARRKTAESQRRITPSREFWLEKLSTEENPFGW